MAVNQRQSLACMQGDCHATETPKDRAANHREPTDSTFSILASTSWDYAFQHAFRPRLPTYHSDRGRYVFRQNWLYCWSLALCSVELPIALSLAADGKDKQRDDTQLLS